MNKKNFIWNTLGSMLFGFTSLFYAIIITRINGVDSAGAFTYAFANACVFYTIGVYSGKIFQITETNKRITDTDYIQHRFFTSVLMNICAIIFVLITKPGFLKTFLIIILTFYRSVEAFTETFHAITQRNGKLYQVGISLFIRSIVLIISFLIIDLFTKNLILSCIIITLITILFSYFVDYKNIKEIYQKSSFNFDNQKVLLKTGFTLFCYTFLSIYVINIPKYAINYYSTDTIQAIFGIIIMPASFLALISQYIVQPFLNDITSLVENNKITDLKKLIAKIFIYIIMIGLLILPVCYVLGIPVLELVYGIELNSYLLAFMIIMVGAIFYSLIIIMSSIFVVFRKNNIQLFILIAVALSSLIMTYILVMKYDILGASLSYSISMFIEFIIYLIALICLLRKKGNYDMY